MMIALLIIVVGAIIVWMMFYQEALESKQYEEARDAYYGEQYTEDIDFSLGPKGYPVVNDDDIGYTQWQADRGLG